MLCREGGHRIDNPAAAFHADDVDRDYLVGADFQERQRGIENVAVFIEADPADRRSEAYGVGDVGHNLSARRHPAAIRRCSPFDRRDEHLRRGIGAL